MNRVSCAERSNSNTILLSPSRWNICSTTDCLWNKKSCTLSTFQRFPSLWSCFSSFLCCEKSRYGNRTHVTLKYCKLSRIVGALPLSYSTTWKALRQTKSKLILSPNTHVFKLNRWDHDNKDSLSESPLTLHNDMCISDTPIDSRYTPSSTIKKKHSFSELYHESVR